jgi:ABC-type antimicrobial peptide transport system permease subunit
VWRLFLEALRPASWGVVTGLPGGALVGWLFTSGTRAAMSNWGLPPSFVVPWGIIGAGALGAFAFTVIVALPSAWYCVERSKKM